MKSQDCFVDIVCQLEGNQMPTYLLYLLGRKQHSDSPQLSSLNKIIILMDVTLLYNGYNLQRRQMFTLSPRHNLKSQVEIDWPDSLRHEQLSPLSRMKQRQSLESSKVGEQHNAFVDRYLSTHLGLNDSRIKKIRPLDRDEKLSRTSNPSSHAMSQEREQVLKLPRLAAQQPTKKNDIVSQIIGDKSKGYLSMLLRQRLQKYEK